CDNVRRRLRRGRCGTDEPKERDCAQDGGESSELRHGRLNLLNLVGSSIRPRRRGLQRACHPLGTARMQVVCRDSHPPVVTPGSWRGRRKSMGFRAWGLLVVAVLTPALAAGDLAHDLASPDVVQRRKAVYTLEEAPSLPPEAVAPLVECLHDSDFILAESA